MPRPGSRARRGWPAHVVLVLGIADRSWRSPRLRRRARSRSGPGGPAQELPQPAVESGRGAEPARRFASCPRAGGCRPRGVSASPSPRRDGGSPAPGRSRPSGMKTKRAGAEVPVPGIARARAASHSRAGFVEEARVAEHVGEREVRVRRPAAGGARGRGPSRRPPRDCRPRCRGRSGAATASVEVGVESQRLLVGGARAERARSASARRRLPNGAR